MKTSAILLSGLILSATLALASTGCRITHYAPPAQSSAVALAAAAKVDPAVVQAEDDGDDACHRRDVPCGCNKGDRRSQPRPQKDPPAQRRAQPAAPPPAACQSDADCPGDTDCDSGECR